jgi:hypothetical protein
MCPTAARMSMQSKDVQTYKPPPRCGGLLFASPSAPIGVTQKEARPLFCGVFRNRLSKLRKSEMTKKQVLRRIIADYSRIIHAIIHIILEFSR